MKNKVETNIICKCGGSMKTGIALVNTPDYGLPDFPGQTDLRGQTMSMTGKAKLDYVWKCQDCGHSVEKHS